MPKRKIGKLEKNINITHHGVSITIERLSGGTGNHGNGRMVTRRGVRYYVVDGDARYEDPRVEEIMKMAWRYAPKLEPGQQITIRTTGRLTPLERYEH